MADIELVIKIPAETYKTISEWEKPNPKYAAEYMLYSFVKNGKRIEPQESEEEEQTPVWAHTIFNKDKIMEMTEQWTKEAEKAGMTLTEYLESLSVGVDISMRLRDEDDKTESNILDKIRTEIMQVANQEKFHDEKWALGLRYAANIVDKYDTESEGKE